MLKFSSNDAHDFDLIGGAAPLQELKRDIHGFIASKANINIELATSYGGETFLVKTFQPASSFQSFILDWCYHLVFSILNGSIFLSPQMNNFS